MYLQQLSLLNFKSYSQVDIHFHPKINCFVGKNGQGKTNLLDGIFSLSMCKSAFNPIDQQNIQHNEPFFVVQGVYQRNDKAENIYCAVKRNSGKVFKRNGKEYQRLAEHVGLIPIVIISPSDTSLILEGSEERRKYINGVVSQYNRVYLDQVVKYNKLLYNRNKMLKEKSFGKSFSYDLLEVIDDQLDELSKPIYSERLDFAEKLTPIFQDYYRRVSANAEEVKLVYRSHLHQQSLKELLKQNLERDLAIQFTSKGIHRDDLELTVNGFPIKKEGSQGHQKTYLIALKLAQFDFLKKVSGYNPILLLDDVFDKLDMERVEQFIQLVAHDGFGQIFITDTNKNRLDEILEKLNSGYTLFSVENGEVQQIRSV